MGFFSWLIGGMQPLFCPLFNVASGQEQKCIPTIAQPTGEWLLYQASAPITSWCTEVIMWIPEQACIPSWSQLKLGQKRRKGLGREDVQSYLEERMWRQSSGEVGTGMSS